LQPGGHRFEPGILHQDFAGREVRESEPMAGRARRTRGARTTAHAVGELPGAGGMRNRQVTAAIVAGLPRQRGT
jgi:hypothetical protein